MSERVLITILGANVAPRFDKTTEVVMLDLNEDGSITEVRTMVLHQSSPEDLCQLIVSEEVRIVVCGGIEEEYYDYLKWKKLEVLDSVMGPYEKVISRLRDKSLEPGMILFERSGGYADGK